MVCAGERRGEEGVHNLECDLDAGGSAAKRQHIGIIVLACHPGRVVIVRERATNALDLVARDRDADAGAAHDNTQFGARSEDLGAEQLGDVCKENFEYYVESVRSGAWCDIDHSTSWRSELHL